VHKEDKQNSKEIVMGELQDQMVMAMRLRNFSRKTIKSYVSVVRGFVRMFGKSPSEMGEEEVRQYLQSLMERKASWATIRQTRSVLKFLYRDTLKREWKEENIPHPKREKRLPVVFSTEEVKRFLEAVKNPKHRLVMMACYSAGLRLSEAVHLKVTDIDSERMQIRVEQGKGKKDRYTLLGKTLLDELRLYWKVYRPQSWLFPGYNPGMPLSERTIENAFAKAKKKAVSPSM
jgi:integrase/recombinase XerD